MTALERHIGLRNGKDLNFEIFYRSDINFTSHYILILEKNFQICKRGKNFIQKLYGLVDNTDDFTIPLTPIVCSPNNTCVALISRYL